ncbi:hypothetical protein SNEBB_008133 [Seison nebaliae]|nr:hypothetical protein SNEBB_008133 [Seison nebaliae]
MSGQIKLPRLSTAYRRHLTCQNDNVRIYPDSLIIDEPSESLKLAYQPSIDLSLYNFRSEKNKKIPKILTETIKEENKFKDVPPTKPSFENVHSNKNEKKSQSFVVPKKIKYSESAHSIFQNTKFEDYKQPCFRDLIPNDEFKYIGKENFNNFPQKSDPIKLAKKGIRTIYGSSAPKFRSVSKSERHEVKSSNYFSKRNDQWEKDLFLPKLNYPEQSKEFSRYRKRHRSTYDAFLDRVAQKLNLKLSDE